jgi:D-3-phosphoglycerate dehydrogenase
MRVIAHDPYLPEPDITARGVTPVSFIELLEQADYLVIQAPLTKETHHLIGEAELRRMKPTAFLVNTARAHRQRRRLVPLLAGRLDRRCGP